MKLPVAEFTQRLSELFMDQWRSAMPPNYAGPDMVFVVGGFDDGQPYGTILEFYIPSRPTPVIKHAPGAFGMNWVASARRSIGSFRATTEPSRRSPSRSWA